MSNPDAIAYWKEHIASHLRDPLCEISKVRPANPIRWLGSRLKADAKVPPIISIGLVPCIVTSSVALNTSSEHST
jgi:hypothetical protein